MFEAVESVNAEALKVGMLTPFGSRVNAVRDNGEQVTVIWETPGGDVTTHRYRHGVPFLIRV